MSQEELSRLALYASLPRDLQNAASRLIHDMSTITGRDESSAVLEAVPLFVGRAIAV